jgi:hypothetical protein
MSPDLQSKPAISKYVIFHADPHGNTRGSKNPRQAESTVISRNKPESGFRWKEDLENKFV